MSNATIAMAAPRRLALQASRSLERWATRPAADGRRAARAAERALAEREQHELRAITTMQLR
ncbi:hypothetical protein LG314_12815 [Agrococcus terreus]|uniref:hypothetical protein n=1 Tax=Agrococcus terreus TaxID=574649 RepID=UPI00384F5112